MPATAVPLPAADQVNLGHPHTNVTATVHQLTSSYLQQNMMSRPGASGTIPGQVQHLKPRRAHRDHYLITLVVWPDLDTCEASFVGAQTAQLHHQLPTGRRWFRTAAAKAHPASGQLVACANFATNKITAAMGNRQFDDHVSSQILYSKSHHTGGSHRERSHAERTHRTIVDTGSINATVPRAQALFAANNVVLGTACAVLSAFACMPCRPCRYDISSVVDADTVALLLSGAAVVSS